MKHIFNFDKEYRDMEKQGKTYQYIKNDKRSLMNWAGRKLKNKIKGVGYYFDRQDFIDVAKAVRYGNFMMTRFYDKKWYKKMINAAFGPVEKPKIQSRVIPLHAKVDKAKSKNAIVPYKLVDDFIDSAGFIIILDECLCRKGMDCKNYPIDIGCIMLGQGSRVMLERGHGREVTAEEAKKYARKGAEAGLVVFAAQAKAEEQMMGIPLEKRHQFIELCFCCPCCCLAMSNLKYYTPEIKKHNFVNVGFAAKALPDCKGCGKCVDICPAGAVRANGNKVWVKEDDCIGCGLCQIACKHDAIQLVQVGKQKGDLIEYFGGLINLDVS
jgi:NAD-dependent dihydropyrimidine dehydrogenase PreA subunit